MHGPREQWSSVAELPALDHRFPPDLAELSLTRRLLRQALLDGGVDGDSTDELLVVASELVTNAIRHAGAGLCRLIVHFESHHAGRIVVIEVRGAERPPGTAPLRTYDADDPFAEGGRGLQIVRAVCDDLEIEVSGSDRVVRCRKAVRTAA